jgi:uncharacterized protein YndB with AHSA1/START domain
MTDQQRMYRADCRRQMKASPEVVLAAWTDPELLHAWMGSRESGRHGKPKVIGVRNVQTASIVGSPFRIDMITREADGSERVWPHLGRIVESTPSRLSFTWSSEGTGNHETIVSLDVIETDEGSELHLSHVGFPTDRMAREHAEGWDILLDLLSEAVLSGLVAGLKIGAARAKARFGGDRKRASQPDGSGGTEDDPEPAGQQ